MHVQNLLLYGIEHLIGRYLEIIFSMIMYICPMDLKVTESHYDYCMQFYINLNSDFIEN